MRTRKEIETRLKQEEKLIKQLIRQSYESGYAKGVMEDSEESANITGWVEALTWILATKKEGATL